MSALATRGIDRDLVERVVRQVVYDRFVSGNGHKPAAQKPRLVVNISARHAHVTQEDLEVLYGPGAKLTVFKPLYQEGEFASEQTVTVAVTNRPATAETAGNATRPALTGDAVSPRRSAISWRAAVQHAGGNVAANSERRAWAVKRSRGAPSLSARATSSNARSGLRSASQRSASDRARLMVRRRT